MRFRFWLAACVSLAALPVSQATAQHLTPEQLDRLSQERQSELGSRNWGPPPTVTQAPQTLHATPVPVTCRSPAHDFEPLFAEPRRGAVHVGTAAPQIAVTDTVFQGWRQVLRSGTTFAWIPEADVVAYRPLVDGASRACVVSGENAAGMVLFTHPAK